MEFGNLTVLTLILLIVSLTIRWRFPTVPNWLASGPLAGSVVFIVCHQLSVESAHAFLAAGAAALVTGMADWFVNRSKLAATLPKTVDKRVTTTFLKNDGDGTIEIEDSFSSADTFFDVKGSPKLTSKRNRHEPGDNSAK